MSSSDALARCRAAALLAGVLVAAPVAAALSQRTFVASTGADSNPCSITQPCRSFATAIGKTNPTGEVIVVDSAGYGPVTITQSVAIIAPQGVYAGISVPAAQSGIVVNGSGILVKLSGLTINGQGGLSGILFLDGSRLVVERCTVVGMTGAALSDSASSSQLYVTDSTFRSSGAGIGISAGNGTATLDRVHVENNDDDAINVSASTGATVDVLVRDSAVSTNNGAGFIVIGNASAHARLTVERSTAFQNTGQGFYATSTGATVQLFVTDSKASENAQSGVFASGAGATAVVTGSTFTRNLQYGMTQVSSSTLATLQNNTVELNVVGPTSGTITKVSLQ